MRKEPFEKYVSNLNREDNSTWKHIKNKRNPQNNITITPNTLIYNASGTAGKKSDKEIAELFAEHLFEVFCPHNNDQVQEAEQDPATATQPQERLKAFALKEIKDEIQMLNQKKKAPSLDLITATLLQELPTEGPLNLMYIFNAIIRLEYRPKSLRIAQMIMIPKPAKNPTDFSFYQPISLQPTIKKVLEKLMLKTITKYLNPQDWIPNHQFGFRQAHSTVQQCHRITDGINWAMENQQHCTAAFLHVSQAFDEVRHPGLLLKTKRILPSSYSNLLKSYLNESQFETKFNGETSSHFHIHSGVPQGGTLGPLLHVLYNIQGNFIRHIRGMTQQYLQLMKTLR